MQVNMEHCFWVCMLWSYLQNYRCDIHDLNYINKKHRLKFDTINGQKKKVDGLYTFFDLDGCSGKLQ